MREPKSIKSVSHSFCLRFLFMLILLCSVSISISQIIKPPNLSNYDNKPYHFGFVLGLNQTDFAIQFSTNVKQFDTVMAVTSSGQGGFNLGIVTDLRLGEFVNLRFIPTLSFSERNLVFSIRRKSDAQYYNITKQIESTFIDFPFDLKFKSERLNNARAYIVMGVKYSIDMAARKGATSVGDINIVKLSRYSYGAHLGFGFDFYTTYFKFSPELKFFNSFNNNLIKDAGPFSGSIDKLLTRAWLISFTFE